MTKTETGKRLPLWLKRPLGRPSMLHEMKSVLRSRNLNTVCESARCPNIGECFTKPTATFMILGDVCTRGCGFCAVTANAPALPPDPGEPANIALTAAELALRHVVITSVTRDDLADGGARQFALTIRALRGKIPAISIEVLVPDFAGDPTALRTVLEAGPDILNHNVETISRQYGAVRPGADFTRSIELLAAAKAAGFTTKSGFMLGLGEKTGEVRELLKALKGCGTDIVTIGQYLSPGKGCLPVVEYVPPEAFAELESYARGIGLPRVYAGPFVRSSYNAEEQFNSNR